MNDQVSLNNKFAKLYKEHYESIYRFVYYNINNKSDVEDIVSQTFYKAFVNINQCNDNFKPWLYQIARNNMIDKAKSFQSKKMSTVNDQVFENFTTDSDEKKIETSNLYKLVLERVESLKPDLRQAFFMRYVDEMDYKDIAKVMEKTELNIRVLVSKALKALRMDLEEERKNIKFIFIPPLMSAHYLKIQNNLSSTMAMNGTNLLTSSFLMKAAAVVATISIVGGTFLAVNTLNKPANETQTKISATPSVKVESTPTVIPTVSTTLTPTKAVDPNGEANKALDPYYGWTEYTNTTMGVKFKLPSQLYVNGNLVDVKVVNGPLKVSDYFWLQEGETGFNNIIFIQASIRGVCGEGLDEPETKVFKSNDTNVNILGKLTKVTYYSAITERYKCWSFDYTPFKSADGTKTFNVDLSSVDDGPVKIYNLSNTAKKILESMQYVR